jgi:aspartyl-tRNA(Asn)/glutamyl-tRNA(Gln) amidotransferase subunit A
MATYYVLAPAEASSNLARFDGIRYGTRSGGSGSAAQSTRRTRESGGFGAEVKRRIMLGTFALSAGYYDEYYGRHSACDASSRRLRSVFDSGVDVLFTPTTPTPAFRSARRPTIRTPCTCPTCSP